VDKYALLGQVMANVWERSTRVRRKMSSGPKIGESSTE